jgi:hypothetical protein
MTQVFAVLAACVTTFVATKLDELLLLSGFFAERRVEELYGEMFEKAGRNKRWSR